MTNLTTFFLLFLNDPTINLLAADSSEPTAPGTNLTVWISVFALCWVTATCCWGFFSIHKKNTHTPIHIHGCSYRCGLCDAPGTQVFGRSAHPGAEAPWRLGSHIYRPRASRFVELYRVEGEFKSWVYKPREAKIHLIMCLSITLALFTSCFTVISISTLGDFTK